MTPKPKVIAATIGAAAATVIVAILQAAGADVSPELMGAIATLCAFGAGYLKAD
jgi:hypothetical protein